MGIWLLLYGINDTDQQRYINWFHDVHMAEKLARPGYDQAVHYRVVNSSAGELTQYIAMFISSTSRAFYDPSPAQLKPRQDALTREMIAYRQQPLSLITSVEWNAQPGNNATELKTIDARCIQLTQFTDTCDDQAVGAWCTQEYFPSAVSAPGCTAAFKLLGSSGQPRHLTLEAYESVAECTAAAKQYQPAELGKSVLAARHRDPLVAELIYHSQ